LELYIFIRVANSTVEYWAFNFIFKKKKKAR